MDPNKKNIHENQPCFANISLVTRVNYNSKHTVECSWNNMAFDRCPFCV